MEKTWITIKNIVYLIGWTFIVAFLTWQNWLIIQYLSSVDPLHTIVTWVLTTMLYPIWIIGIIGIIKFWKAELNNEKINEEDHLTSPGT